MKNITFLTNHLYAHRGLHNIKKDIPENTMLAFKNAINLNYGIEVDINFTKDNKIICFHDQDLLRSSNIKSKVNDLTYESLYEINIFNTNHKIPLLSELLSLNNGKVPLLIEIKNHKNYKKTLPLFCKLMDSYNGEFAVFSFNPFIVYWFKKNKPNYIRGQISSFFKNNKKIPFIFKKLMASLFFNKFTKPDFISYNLDDLPNKYVDKEKRKGTLIFSYTSKNINDLNFSLKKYDNTVFEGFLPNKNILK